MASPTSRTLAMLRELGAEVVEKVEYWNPFSKTRKDLLGFADILTLLGGDIIAVQCTDFSDMSKRRKKIYESRNAEHWLKCGGKIWLVGWGRAGPNNREKRRKGSWFQKTELIELEQLAANE